MRGLLGLTFSWSVLLAEFLPPPQTCSRTQFQTELHKMAAATLTLCMLLCCTPADALRTPGGASSRMSRRECGLLGALSAVASAPALAYDTAKTAKPDFASQEKKRLAREALTATNDARLEPYLQALRLANDGQPVDSAVLAYSLSSWQRYALGTIVWATQ